MIATFTSPASFVANLKAALLAASEDTTRPHMNCVRIELSRGVARFVATNGHWLWLNEEPYREVVGVDDRGKPVLGTSEAVVQINRASAKAILKAVDKSKKAASLAVELDTDANTVRQRGDATTFEPVSSTFPPYAHMLPAATSGEPTAMTYDPTYIAAVAEAFAEVSNERNCGMCIQSCGGALDPVVVTSDRATALAILMPRRHANKPAGDELLARYRAVSTASSKAA